MIIPSEVFIKLSETINDWEKNYELKPEGKLLFLRYVGRDHNAFLDLPEEPQEEDFEGDEEMEGYFQYSDEIIDWRQEVGEIIDSYCDSLSGAGYKVSILGEYTNSKGFVYIFS